MFPVRSIQREGRKKNWKTKKGKRKKKKEKKKRKPNFLTDLWSFSVRLSPPYLDKSMSRPPIGNPYGQGQRYDPSNSNRESISEGFSAEMESLFGKRVASARSPPSLLVNQSTVTFENLVRRTTFLYIPSLNLFKYSHTHFIGTWFWFSKSGIINYVQKLTKTFLFFSFLSFLSFLFPFLFCFFFGLFFPFSFRFVPYWLLVGSFPRLYLGIWVDFLI